MVSYGLVLVPSVASVAVCTLRPGSWMPWQGQAFSTGDRWQEQLLLQWTALQMNCKWCCVLRQHSSKWLDKLVLRQWCVLAERYMSNSRGDFNC